MDQLKWLESWYQSNCDGDWEHTNGIRIETLDNPGWSVEIDLHQTDYEDTYFETIEYEKSSGDWVHCKVENNTFYGYGGATNLGEIIQIFRDWQSVQKKKTVIQNVYTIIYSCGK
jgi:hypothetical protein